MDLQLAGLSAVVTGAASGIGAATVRLLAAEGATVFAGDVNTEGVETLVATLNNHAGAAYASPMDVSSRESVDRAVANASQHGGIDILINSAGIVEYGDVEAVGTSAWDHLLDVNLRGVLYCVQAALPYLRRSRFASITNVASLAGRTGGLYAAPHYAASKGGVIALTRNLALQLGHDGIRVNCINPGAIDTPMTGLLPPQVRADIESRHPLGRFGTADEVAAAVGFLASPRASYINGAQLDVNGGIAMI
jgi:2-keto-3-deoxy-L-fuconate dehydrogenase